MTVAAGCSPDDRETLNHISSKKSKMPKSSSSSNGKRVSRKKIKVKKEKKSKKIKVKKEKKKTKVKRESKTAETTTPKTLNPVDFASHLVRKGDPRLSLRLEETMATRVAAVINFVLCEWLKRAAELKQTSADGKSEITMATLSRAAARNRSLGIKSAYISSDRNDKSPVHPFSSMVKVACERLDIPVRADAQLFAEQRMIEFADTLVRALHILIAHHKAKKINPSHLERVLHVRMMADEDLAREAVEAARQSARTFADAFE